MEIEDRQVIFNALFVHYFQNAIRNLVRQSEIITNILLTIDRGTYPGILWDFTGSFRERGYDRNLRTFNGVHSPRDQEELIHNIAILSTIN